VIVLILSYFTLTPTFWPFALNTLLMGFFVIPDTAICLAFAGDASYPAEQTMVNGIISLLGHGVAGIMALPATAITKSDPKSGIIFVGALCLLGALPTIWVEEDLRRTKAEAMRESILVSAEDDDVLPRDANAIK